MRSFSDALVVVFTVDGDCPQKNMRKMGIKCWPSPGAMSICLSHVSRMHRTPPPPPRRGSARRTSSTTSASARAAMPPPRPRPPGSAPASRPRSSPYSPRCGPPSPPHQGCPDGHGAGTSPLSSAPVALLPTSQGTAQRRSLLCHATVGRIFRLVAEGRCPKCGWSGSPEAKGFDLEMSPPSPTPTPKAPKGWECADPASLKQTSGSGGEGNMHMWLPGFKLSRRRTQ